MRILFGMTCSKPLDKQLGVTGPYVGTACVVKLKEYAFIFHREPADFVPDAEFVPYFWRRKGDDANGENGGLEEGSEGPMKTPDMSLSHTTSMDVDGIQSSGAANHGKTVVTHPSTQKTTMVLTPYNPNPQTPRRIEIVSRIRRVSPGLLRVVDAEFSSPGD